MFDFANNEALARLIAEFYENSKIVSAVCHGPCGLLNVKLSNGNYLIKDKLMQICSEEDIFLWSDLDEIPNPEVVKSIHEFFEPDTIFHLACYMKTNKGTRFILEKNK